MTQIVIDPCDAGQDRLVPADMALAKDIADTLDHHYPGHAWAVYACHAKGIAWIKNIAFSEKMGFLFKVGEVDDWRKAVVMAGGEFLERWGQRRGAFDESTWMGASDGL